MPTRLLPQLLAQLHPPLGITRKYSRLEIMRKLGEFHIRDHEGMVHFVETLIPLSRAVLGVELTDREERRQQALWHTGFPELDELPILRLRERAVHVGHFFCATYIASAYRRSVAIKKVQEMREDAAMKKIQSRHSSLVIPSSQQQNNGDQEPPLQPPLSSRQASEQMSHDDGRPFGDFGPSVVE